MKFVRVNGGRTGLVVVADGQQILDIESNLTVLREHDRAAASAIERVLPPGVEQRWTAMIDGWDGVRGAFQALIGLAEGGRDFGFATTAFSESRFDAPLAAPDVHIFSFSSNTAIHIQRAFKAMKGLDLSEADVLKPRMQGLPPGGFTIWPDTVVGHKATVAPPPGSQTFDYEGECAVFLKKGGLRLEDVKLWGYAAWNDFGVRDTHLGLVAEAPWAPFSLNLPKNFDTGNSCGPWVSVDECKNINELRCVLRVNGEVRQDWNLADMIYPFEDMFRHVSSSLSLRPGDVVTSGTGAGVAIEGGVESPHWLKPGDVVEVELDGAGSLINTIGDF